MHITFLGYGVSPRLDGGATAIQAELIEYLLSKNHRVSLIETCNYSLGGKVHLSLDRNTRYPVYRVWNSPSWPGKRDPILQQSNPEVELLISSALLRLMPDILHVHELTFASAAVIGLARKLRIPVAKTIHNYWDVCPERDLLFNGRVQCNDYDRGEKCTRCTVLIERKPFRMQLSRMLRKKPWMGKLAKTFAGIRQKLNSNPKCDTDRNVIKSSPEISTRYLLRRQCYVDALNACSFIHCYSNDSIEKMRGFGVKPELLKYVPVSTRVIDGILPKEKKVPGGGLNFVYRGGLAPNKGVHSLIEGFCKSKTSSARLTIYGDGVSDYVTRLKQLSRGRNVRFAGAYLQSDLNYINSETDVGCVPSIASEIFGLVGIEYLNAGVPIIGSRIGGIPDYVRAGRNGLLFEPGDVDQISEVFELLISNPSKVSELAANASRWSTVEDMGGQMVNEYLAVL
jgi:glycosyltransferase involved in cell wall biosynthesis